MGLWISAVPRAIAALLIPLTLLVTAPIASAHVNRTVGPYAIFLILIEEPFFTTNRAGFEFWVRKGDQPILGLDGTLRAEATGSGRQVDLLVSPLNERGFYDVEADLTGQPFDPGSGRDWTLRLVGTIEGIPIDESIATQFPGYPRAGTPASPAVSPAAATDDPASLLVIAGPLVVAAWMLARVARSRRRHAQGSTAGA